MRDRSGSLTVATACLVALWLVAPVHAHRLEARFRVLPGQRVQVECWYDVTGDTPEGASVRVLGVGGRVVTEGKLDSDGQFTFPFTEVERLKIVLHASEGHRTELTVPAGALERALGSGSGLAPDEAGPTADRKSGVAAGDVLAGLGFLLGLAAFLLSLRTARRVRTLESAATWK